MSNVHVGESQNSSWSHDTAAHQDEHKLFSRKFVFYRYP